MVVALSGLTAQQSHMTRSKAPPQAGPSSFSGQFRPSFSIGRMHATLRRTPLYEKHVEAGARLVPFAGWEMPVQYEGVIAEHRAVRTDAGVFDVSHMGEIEVEGPKAFDLLQHVLSNDLGRLHDGDAQYTLLCNDEGGIVDDLIVYRLDDCRYLLVVNASNREADFEWIAGHELRGSDVRDVSDDYALLAVQGPRALERLGLPAAKAFTWEMGQIDGVEVMINRTGYTGEEGVELACMADDAPQLWDAVLARGVRPCGLGARDTLRLEVCYPLHGNDIGPQWDAISSGLGWVCALDTGFIGSDPLREVKEQGPERKLIAFVMTEQAIPRRGMSIEGGGEVTSGSLSPMLGVGIGLGYVPAEASATETELTVDVRGRPRHGKVVPKPIYKREE
jgi:aminomethyltransferase